MTNRVLVDSSYFIALLNSEDRYHESALTFSESINVRIVVPEIIIVEVVFMLQARRGQHMVVGFYDFLMRDKPQLEYLNYRDLERVREIKVKYRQFDFVDTAIMALSERLDITSVCTFDRRHFGAFKPNHCDYLELLP